MRCVTGQALDQVRFLVLDEADRMLEAGFLPTLLQIAGRCAPRALSAERETALRAALQRYRREDPGTGVARAMKRLKSEESREVWAAGVTGSDVGHVLDTLKQPAAEEHSHANTALRQTMFVSATWAATVQDAAAKVMGDNAVELHVEQPAFATGSSGSSSAPQPDDTDGGETRYSGSGLKANRDVKQRVEVVNFHKEKLPRLRAELASLRTRNPGARATHCCLPHSLPHTDLRSSWQAGTCVMIFCKTKKRCDWLAGQLEAGEGAGESWVKALHSGKSQPEREQALHEFRALASSNSGAGGVLVATNVASRGLDIPAMSLVIVYDFHGLESYVHQIGRTGRGEGRAGESLAFYVQGDGEAAELVQLLHEAGQPVSAKLASLAAGES